ncbi:hypothetical protein Rin_00009650, partial [Candidatus Regiella insecticola 5.15]
MKKRVISLLDEAATAALGASMARACNSASIVYLLGD